MSICDKTSVLAKTVLEAWSKSGVQGSSLILKEGVDYTKMAVSIMAALKGV